MQLAKQTEPSLANLSDQQALSLVQEVFKQVPNDNKLVLTLSKLGKFKIYKIAKKARLQS